MVCFGSGRKPALTAGYFGRWMRLFKHGGTTRFSSISGALAGGAVEMFQSSQSEFKAIDGAAVLHRWQKLPSLVCRLLSAIKQKKFLSVMSKVSFLFRRFKACAPSTATSGSVDVAPSPTSGWSASIRVYQVILESEFPGTLDVDRNGCCYQS